MRITTESGTIRLAGRFDVRSTAAVRETLYRLIEGGDGDVVVDLSDGAVTLTGPAELVATVEVPWL